MRTFTLSLLILLGLALPAAAQGTRYIGPSADTTARDAARDAQAAADAAQADADTAQTDATAALLAAKTQTYQVGLLAGGEVANSRLVTIEVVDRAGVAATSAVQLFCELRDASMLPEVVGAFRFAVTFGTADSTTARPAMLLTTTAWGAASITVTDVAGASGLTTHLFCRPVGAHGSMTHLAITFDGV